MKPAALLPALALRTTLLTLATIWSLANPTQNLLKKSAWVVVKIILSASSGRGIRFQDPATSNTQKAAVYLLGILDMSQVPSIVCYYHKVKPKAT